MLSIFRQMSVTRICSRLEKYTDWEVLETHATRNCRATAAAIFQRTRQLLRLFRVQSNGSTDIHMILSAQTTTTTKSSRGVGTLKKSLLFWLVSSHPLRLSPVGALHCCRGNYHLPASGAAVDAAALFCTSSPVIIIQKPHTQIRPLLMTRCQL